MCIRKKSITSPARTYRPVYSRLGLEVPCGKCAQCISQAQDDWFVRTWSEIDKYNKAEGKVIFATFTYRNRDLPIFYYDSVDKNTGEVFTHKIPCFNKEHKDYFVHAFADYFRNKGVDFTKTSLPFHFMFPSEYGMSDEYEDDHHNLRLGTHRPHYHVLLFLPKEAYEVFHSVEDCKFTIQRFWKYGEVRWSQDWPIFVVKDFAGRYVSKYMTKQIEFYHQPEVDAFLYDEDGKRIPERWEAFKKFAPQHWQSQGYGIDLLNMCQDDKVFKDGLDLHSESDISAGKKKMYRVPRYIVRKALYEVDDLNRLVLNDRGLKFFRNEQNFAEKIAKLKCDYIQFFTPEYLDQRLTGDDYAEFGTSNSRDLIGFFKDILGDRNIEELSLYSFCLKNRGVGRAKDILGRLYIKSFETMSRKQLYKSCYDIYAESLQLDFGSDWEFDSEGFVKNLKKSPYFQPFTFNFLKRFAGFDQLLDMFQKVKDIYVTASFEAYEHKRMQKKLTRLSKAS